MAAVRGDIRSFFGTKATKGPVISDDVQMKHSQPVLSTVLPIASSATSASIRAHLGAPAVPAGPVQRPLSTSTMSAFPESMHSENQHISYDPRSAASAMDDDESMGDVVGHKRAKSAADAALMPPKHIIMPHASGARFSSPEPRVEKLASGVKGTPIRSVIGSVGAGASSSVPGYSFSPVRPPLAPLAGSWAPRAAPGCLDNMIVVTTGEFDHINRDVLKGVIERYGGKVTTAVSGKTSMLVYGSRLEDGRAVADGGKMRNAREEEEKAATGLRKAGPIQILSERQFYEFLENSLPPSQAEEARIARVAASEVALSAGMEIVGSYPAPSVLERNGTPGGVESSPPSIPPPQLWADKYRPKTAGELVGNSPAISALDAWLASWESIHVAGVGLKPKWSRENPGARAALISGPPGIGKTTTAALLGRRHGYEVLELNASDSRAAKDIKNIVGEAVGNQTLHWGASPAASASDSYSSGGRRRLVIMDEVDGMSGGDRGGNAELIKLIKLTKVPVICICNDRQHPKVRSLANSCYDVKFSPPSKDLVASRVGRIAQAEGLTIDQQTAESLVESCGGDIRQVLNTLQMYAVRASSMSSSELKSRMSSVNKDALLRLDAMTATPRMFIEAHTATLDARMEFFFVDYDMIPLTVAQMYAEAVSRTGGTSQTEERSKLTRLAKAADCVTIGDVYSEYIRNRQAWGLLPSMAVANVRATTYAACPNPGFIFFPQWLGKNSSRHKRARLLAELGLHMAQFVSGGREAIRLDYVDPLRITLTAPLLHVVADQSPADSARLVISLLDEYGLSNDDLIETLVKEVHFPPTTEAGIFDLEKAIPPMIKAALTREWKKGSHRSMALNMAVPAGLVSSVARGKKGSGGGSSGLRISMDGEEVDDDDGEVDAEEGDDGDPAATSSASGSAVGVPVRHPAKPRGKGAATGAASTRGRGASAGGAKGSRATTARGKGRAAGSSTRGRGASAAAKRKRSVSDDDKSDDIDDVFEVADDDSDL